MEAMIDGKTLFDSSGEFRVGVIPTSLLLDQTQTIRSIPINLVGRHMDERRLWTPLALCLEEVEGAARVHIENVEGSRGCQIVAGLSRRMNDRVRPDLLNQIQDRSSIPDIQLVGMEVAILLSQSSPIPGSVAWRTKEIGPQIVIDPVHFAVLCCEKGDCLAADQSARAGYQQVLHLTTIMPDPVSIAQKAFGHRKPSFSDDRVRG